MISVSRKAAAGLREQLILMCFEAGIGFRVLVSIDKSGRKTFSVKIGRQRQGDKVIDSDNVKVFLDPSSAAQIKDYQLDYQDGPGGGFFLKTAQEAKSG